MRAGRGDVSYYGWHPTFLLWSDIIDYRWIELLHFDCVYSYDAFFQEKYKKE